MHDHLPPGVELVKADEFTEWLMDIKVLDDNPLYRNEVYRLKFRFPNNYPIGMPDLTSLLPNLQTCLTSHPLKQKPPKWFSSRMTRTRYRGTHTSTLMASSVLTYLTVRAGVLFTM